MQDYFDVTFVCLFVSESTRPGIFHMSPKRDLFRDLQVLIKATLIHHYTLGPTSGCVSTEVDNFQPSDSVTARTIYKNGKASRCVEGAGSSRHVIKQSPKHSSLGTEALVFSKRD
jgi:hypothetical protein